MSRVGQAPRGLPGRPAGTALRDRDLGPPFRGALPRVEVATRLRHCLRPDTGRGRRRRGPLSGTRPYARLSRRAWPIASPTPASARRAAPRTPPRRCAGRAAPLPPRGAPTQPRAARDGAPRRNATTPNKTRQNTARHSLARAPGGTICRVATPGVAPWTSAGAGPAATPVPRLGATRTLEPTTGRGRGVRANGIPAG